MGRIFEPLNEEQIKLPMLKGIKKHKDYYYGFSDIESVYELKF